MKTCKINVLENNQRMSTQKLVQLINEKVKEGCVDFEINALGEHDIAGALWAKDKNKKLNFKVINPGQRVGAMALNGTKITVIGSAPADVGWLNSGAEITVLGDTGDTAGHCAASGKIYVQGSVGARSGALMKHDPKFEEPELWVLKNTGSFSFEFMSGGIAVICGLNCEHLKSVLSNRSCVGMVGGKIYARGKLEGLSDSVKVEKLNKDDEKFLLKGLKTFLKEVKSENCYSKLTNFSDWKKIVPLDEKDKNKPKISVKEFREKYWFKGGLFEDLIEDNLEIYSLAETDKARLKIPKWDKEKCVSCNLCLNNCPYSAISKENDTYLSNVNLCIGCGICSAVCPKSAWKMEDNI